MRTHAASLEPPLLRGYLHLAAAIASPFGLLYLLFVADTRRALVGAVVFGVGLVFIYTISVTHHLLRQSPGVRDFLGRLDHSMIFIFVASTYTPFGLIWMSQAWAWAVLSVVWGLAGVGVVGSMTIRTAPRWVPVALYALIGLVAIAPLVRFGGAVQSVAVAMVALGGALYYVGALVYIGRRPNPFPRVFGYHEVFHVLELGGTGAFYAAIAVYVLPS